MEEVETNWERWSIERCPKFDAIIINKKTEFINLRREEANSTLWKWSFAAKVQWHKGWSDNKIAK